MSDASRAAYYASITGRAAGDRETLEAKHLCGNCAFCAPFCVTTDEECYACYHTDEKPRFKLKSFENPSVEKTIRPSASGIVRGVRGPYGPRKPKTPPTVGKE